MLDPHEKYDLIYSYFGAAHHSNLKVTAIEKVIKFLKPGGIAAIDLGVASGIKAEKIDKTTLKEIRTLFAQNGIRKATFGKRAGITYVRFQKPFSKLP